MKQFLLVLIFALSVSAGAQVDPANGVVVSGGVIFATVSSSSPSTGADFPDTSLLTWNTSRAANPAGSPTSYVCVGTLHNVAALSGGCSQTYTIAQLQTALTNAVCGQTIVVQNTTYVQALTLPNNVPCANNNQVYLSRDITDTTFPAEGQRIDPCYIGIAPTAMRYYPYPGWDACASPARHMPAFVSPLTSGNPVLGFNAGTSGPAISHWRLVGIEFTRCPANQNCSAAQNFDIGLSIIDLDYQPGFGGSGDCATTGSGIAQIPVNAVACMNDQPTNIICDQCLIHGDAQRQTVIGLKMGGVRFIACVDCYFYDIGVTYAGGGGDGHALGWGTGHGYTNVGWGEFRNTLLASSTQSSEFCGAFVEPRSPATGQDGVPQSVELQQMFLWKNPLWDTQIGQTLNETEVIEGQSYGPQPDQELDLTPSTLTLAVNQAFLFHVTVLNESSGGIDRVCKVGNNGCGTTVTLTCGTGSCGAISIVGEHNVNSGAWLIQNAITYTYTAPASVPSLPVTITFSAIVNDDRLATLGLNRTLSATSTVTIVASSPTEQIAVSPNSPTLRLQPLYQDTCASAGDPCNLRQFCVAMFQVANYTPASVTWAVDGISGGNSSVGTVTSSATGLAAGSAAYCSGTGLGAHTITATANDGTVGSSVITVSTAAPIMDYDLKPYTSKNVFELKCGKKIYLHHSIGEVAWGSNGNGGGQPGNAILFQVGNQANQNNDGTGTNVGYGPEVISDINVAYVHELHVGGGFVLAALNAALGEHRVSIMNVEGHDWNYVRWLHGFQKIGQILQYSGTANSTKVLSWTSPTTPLIDNVSIRHATVVGTSTSIMSLADDIKQYPLIGFVFQDSIVAANGPTAFANNNGDQSPGCNVSLVVPCDYNQGGSNGNPNTEPYVFQGLGFSPAKPLVTPYVLDHDAFLDNTSTAGTFNAATAWQPLSTATDLFSGYVNGFNDDLRVCVGAGNPTASCTAGTYAAGGSRQASDGLALGADTAGIATSDAAVRLGTRTP